MSTTEFDYKNIISLYKTSEKKGIEYYSRMGLKSLTFKKVNDYLKNNLIDIKIEDDITVNEKLVTLFEVTFYKLKPIIVNIYSDLKWTSAFDKTSSKYNEFLNSIQNNFLLSFSNILNKLNSKYTFKKEVSLNNVANAILIEALNYKFIKSAHLDLVSTLLDSIVKYFIANKDKEPNLKDENYHFKDCFKIFNAIIEEKVNRLKREVKSWVSSSNNIQDVLKDYITIKIDAIDFFRQFTNAYK